MTGSPPRPDHPAIKALSVPDAINNVLFMVILLCVLSYFFFSFEQKHPGSERFGEDWDAGC